MTDDLFPSPQRFVPGRRTEIAALAAFRGRARAIADDAGLSADERLSSLKRLGADAPGEHAARLIQAFQKDVTATRFRNWSELIAYCRFAAAPIGRFLIELHGEDREFVRAAETLYAAKHVLRRLQSCRTDYLTHGRVYLPADWMRQAGVERDALGSEKAGPALRRVFARVLDGVDDMLRLARSGLSHVEDRQLRIALQTEIAAARRLASRLRRSDPLARPVRLSRPVTLVCIALGHARGYRRR
jgi:farnesyl-diphosphate farnesyltransferase